MHNNDWSERYFAWLVYFIFISAVYTCKFTNLSKKSIYTCIWGSLILWFKYEHVYKIQTNPNVCPCKKMSKTLETEINNLIIPTWPFLIKCSITYVSFSFIISTGYAHVCVCVCSCLFSLTHHLLIRNIYIVL